MRSSGPDPEPWLRKGENYIMSELEIFSEERSGEDIVVGLRVLDTNHICKIRIPAPGSYYAKSADIWSGEYDIFLNLVTSRHYF